MEVRRARGEDLDRVREIGEGTSQVARWTRAAYEKYASELREDLFHRCLLVAVDAGRVVGFVAGSFLEGDEAGLLENLAVDAGSRRRGVAKALCGALAEWAKSEGAEGLELEVRVSNVGAQSLYAGLGFVQRGLRKRYYSDPEEDAMLMGLRFG